jgi:hypothetical protein
VLRAGVLATAAAHVASGDVLYAVFVLVAVVLAILPALLARSHAANVPLEIELVVLWLVIADMTVGHLAGFYELAYFDKLLHFGNSVLLGMVAFLAVYVLHFVGRTRRHAWIDGAAILLLTLGLGALWEIGEYAADHLFHRATQGAPGLEALDDTMWDLILDGAGGVLGALLGPLYMHRSRRSRRRILSFAALLSLRARFPDPPRRGRRLRRQQASARPAG